MNWIDALQSLDAAIFTWINQGWSNPVFDLLLPLCREKWFWAPLYLFVAAFTVLNFGKKSAWIIAGLVLAVALADHSSSEWVKKNVQRLRPCNDPALRETVVLRLDSCGSGYSFTSSHAANHFAAAVFLIGVFGGLSRWVRIALLGWASLVALSQVYVGVHYPGDVIGGGLLGALLGWWTWRTGERLRLLPRLAAAD